MGANQSVNTNKIYTSASPAPAPAPAPGKLIRGFGGKPASALEAAAFVVDFNHQPGQPGHPGDPLLKELLVEALTIGMEILGLSQKEVPYLPAWAEVIADQLLVLLESGVPPHDYYCLHGTDVTKMVTRIYKQYARHHFRQSK